MAPILNKLRGKWSIRSNIVIVRAAPGSRSRALVQCGCHVFPAAIGRSGRTVLKREGDGATPIGQTKVLYGFMRGDRVNGVETALPMRRIRPDMLWCDAPAHAAYNRLVRAPFKPSHETMQRSDGLYDICLVLDWNITSRQRNRGSAIFFHLAKPGYRPTEGCIAVSLRDMQRLLRVVSTGTVVSVV